MNFIFSTQKKSQERQQQAETQKVGGIEEGSDGGGWGVGREGKTLSCFQFVGERLSGRTPYSPIQLEEPTGLQIELRL